MAFYSARSNHNDFDLRHGEDPQKATAIFAKSYRMAADKLAQSMLENGFRVYEPLPILFLYRHSLELYLKSIINQSKIIIEYDNYINKLNNELRDMPRNTHALEALFEAVKKIVHLVFSDVESRAFDSNCGEFISELLELDPKSENFRYPYDTKGKTTVTKEKHLSLEGISESYGKILDYLDYLNLGLDIKEDEYNDIIDIIEAYDQSIVSEYYEYLRDDGVDYY